MAKSTMQYWNPLLMEQANQWEVIPDTDGMIEQLTLAIDEATGDYTRLTRFKAGVDTASAGAKIHNYPEEILILSGRIYDAAFDMWLEAGHYASRPPGEVHGPFTAETDCVVLEMSYPSQAI